VESCHDSSREVNIWNLFIYLTMLSIMQALYQKIIGVVNSKWCGRKWLFPNLRYCLGIWLEGLRNSKWNLSEVSAVYYMKVFLSQVYLMVRASFAQALPLCSFHSTWRLDCAPQAAFCILATLCNMTDQKKHWFLIRFHWIFIYLQRIHSWGYSV
jgi:hypothetical protein